MAGGGLGAEGQWKLGSRADLAAHEGLGAVLSASLAGPAPKPSKHLPFWQGLGQSCGWAGRGLSAQGNRSSRSASRGDFPRLLPPTQRLPPLVLELDQALPAKSSRLHSSAPGWAAPVWGAETRAEPRTDKGLLVAAQVPCRQGWLPVYRLLERATELGGLKRPHFYVSLVRSHPSQSRGFWAGEESANGKQQ